MFFKLEDKKTIHLSHVSSATSHYIFKEPNKSIFPTRREDCIHANDGCDSHKDPENYVFNVNEIVINYNKQIKLVENYGERLGDEFFIPQELNTFFTFIVNKKLLPAGINVKKADNIVYIDTADLRPHSTEYSRIGGRRKIKTK